MPPRRSQTDKPTELTMTLFDPGMTVLHRAGLGGLACTLKYLERARKKRALADDRLPGGPWQDGKPPWSIDDQTVRLCFGAPENAGDYLRRLFAIAFQIKDGLIYLPGQYCSDPNQAIRADLQAGLTLTFLQHGKVRRLAREPVQVSYDPDDTGVPGVVVEYRPCEYFKHQDGWQELIDNKGNLTTNPCRVDGPISPGSVVRHVAFSADTTVEDTPNRLLPLYFAIVGCLALPINRGVAALIVPEVDDLQSFVEQRPLMTPTSACQCQIASAADGALQAQVRLRSHEISRNSNLPGCYAMTLRSTPWASQQKSRVATVMVPPGEDQRLERFELALAELPPRIKTRTVNEGTGRGRNRVVNQRTESFRVDSIVRPLVAENLALGRPWYRGFVRLMTALDASGKPLRNKLYFERSGLHTMTNSDLFWEDQGESAIVRAVHEALRNRYGTIAKENEGKPVAMRKRFRGEYDRWRLAFAGAKIASQFRRALCDLFSRARPNTELQQSWLQVLPFLDQKRWELTRDLALLALASYAGRGANDEVAEDTPDMTKAN